MKKIEDKYPSYPNRLTSYLEENYDDELDNLLLLDGFEPAFIGVVESFGGKPKACYSAEKCIDILMEDNMSHEEAVEYFSFNIEQAYVGEYTPAFIHRFTFDDNFKF